MIVPQTKNIDTRAYESIPTVKVLEYNNAVHVLTVIGMLNEFVYNNMFDVLTHDKDKFGEKCQEQLEAFIATTKGGKFMHTPWWKHHATNENHHILDHLNSNPNFKDEINLFHFIHMCADWVSAGLARKGEIYDIENKEKWRNVLMLAFENTITQMRESAKVIPGGME